MKLNCPRCNTGLARRWAGKALYQLCVNCHGIAITKYALAGIADPNEVHNMWAQALGDSSPSSLKCPSCLKSMIQAYSHDGKQAHELDACTRCQILWLDKGEYEGMHSGAREPLPNVSPSEKVIVEAPSPEADSYGMGTVMLALVGLPVEEDVGVLARVPVVTRSIFTLVILASLWGFAHSEEMAGRFGFRAGVDPLRFLSTSISSFFFHAGWWHLIGNMYFFWIFGDDVESELGHENFLLLLFASVMGASLFYCLGPSAASVPVIGASGGIAGLILYYVVRFPQRRFRMMFFFRIFSVRAWAVGGFYFLMYLIGSADQMSGHGRVSHLSHLGGALVGILWALYVKAQDRKTS